MRHLGAAVLGVSVAMAALAVHRAGLLLLALAILASLTPAWAFIRSPWPRLGATYSLAWLVVFGVAVAGRPEGDYVLATDFSGYGLMGAGFVLVVLGIGALTARPPGRPT